MTRDDEHDRSLRAQMARNAKSDRSYSGGCLVAMPAYAAAMYILFYLPLSVIEPDPKFIHPAGGVASAIIGSAALAIGFRQPRGSFRRSSLIWLGLAASVFAILFLALSLDR